MVSIITIVFNNKQFIESAILSVLSQSYPNIEYIVIDGGSTDGTVQIINKYRNRISEFVSEKDRGMYDGLNKGLKLAKGEIIGTLHSDDIYADNTVIENVVKNITDSNTDVAWGDLAYIRRDDTSKIFRFWNKARACSFCW